VKYEALSAAEKLLVDIINGDKQIRLLGDARFGNSLQQRGLARVTYPPGEPRRVCIAPTQLGRNWAAKMGLIKAPEKVGSDAR
jgi:hypothetical protein